MFKTCLDFCRQEDGASAAEYALILAIVTTGIAGATLALGDVINTAIQTAANCISDPGTGTCGGGDTPAP